MSSILNHLNKEQYEAATAKEPTILILASAGSGKTRTLIGRVEYLVQRGVEPSRIVLLTFTNKAAGELISRVSGVTGELAASVCAMTFHSFCNMRLRALARRAKIPDYKLITPADTVDVIRFLRDKEDDVLPEGFPTCSNIASMISYARNKMIPVEEAVSLFHIHESFLEKVLDLKRKYAVYKEKHAMFDFDDLLMHYLYLLGSDEEIRKEEEGYIDYLMVDEYQDTNLLQENILVRLRRKNKNLCVVGDPQQSLYSFRGAEVNNILEFADRWPGAKIVNLFVNYRSYKPICAAANNIIRKEALFSIPAPMKSNRGDGPPVVIRRPDNLFDEADKVLAEVLEYHVHNVPLKDMAILSRTTREMVPIESKMIKNNIRYKKTGGLKFMDKVCVRDVLAFLKILFDCNDDKSWHRILSLAPGLGKVTSAKIAEELSDGYDALKSPDRAETKYAPFLRELYKKIAQWRNTAFPLFLDDLIDWYIKKRKDAVRTSKMAASRKDDAFAKIEREKEDLKALSYLVKPEHSDIKSFLDDIALDNSQQEDDEDVLTLSTIHGAKGLEWGYVWILCCVDGVFPSTDASERGSDDDQEELRCMYVAMTRARDRLFISSPLSIIVNGKVRSVSPSHFLDALWAARKANV